MNQTHAKPDTRGTFTGWHMLIIMVSFFAVIFAVNLFMALSSMRTWTGLVVENSYVASQQFNTKLANARIQQGLGWQGGLDYADGTLTFRLHDSDGVPLEIETVTIALSRPIGVNGDQKVTLQPAPDGDHVIDVALAPGVWNAAIVAEFTDQPTYEHRARLVVAGGTE